MRTDTKPLPFVLALAAQTSAKSVLRLTLVHASPAPIRLSPSVEARFSPETDPAMPATQGLEPVSIYVVDDLPPLTELYEGLLEATGYVVRVFNDRAMALEALAADENKPALLITDYVGLRMPAETFIHACRSVHPGLRILMASGLEQNEMRFFKARPDRFIKKPFALDEFQQEVRRALANR